MYRVVRILHKKLKFWASKLQIKRTFYSQFFHFKIISGIAVRPTGIYAVYLRGL